MSNEEKIIEMLRKMRSDIGTLRSDVDQMMYDMASFRTRQEDDCGAGNPAAPEMTRAEIAARQMEIFHKMSNLLSDDERESFGAFMDAEEARKAALYGA